MITLKVGKKYKNRNGDIVVIIRKSSDEYYPYTADDDIYYTSTGHFYTSAAAHELDLVEEVIEAPLLMDEIVPGEGIRLNKGKLDPTYCTPLTIEKIAECFSISDKANGGKYPKDNWKLITDRQKVLPSMIRHMLELLKGEEFDSETGLSHVSHVAANCQIYLNILSKEGKI